MCALAANATSEMTRPTAYAVSVCRSARHVADRAPATTRSPYGGAHELCSTSQWALDRLLNHGSTLCIVPPASQGRCMELSHSKKMLLTGAAVLGLAVGAAGVAG